LVLLFCLGFCFSCEKSAVDGDCPDPIKLSKEELLFNSEGGIENVTLEDTFWWLTGLSHQECENLGTINDPNYCASNYCSHNGNASKNLIMKIKCSWFEVAQTDEYTLLVSVNKNETGEEKKQYVQVEAGNCFSGFWVNQSAE
jgi:hypothetical protein